MIGPSIITVSAQVTFVASIGLVAASLLRGAAHRHNVLLAAMLCMLGSPLFYLLAAGSGLSVNLPAVFPVARKGAQAYTPHRPAPFHGPTAPPMSAEIPAEIPNTAIDGPLITRSDSAIESAAGRNQLRQSGRSWLFLNVFISAIWLVGTMSCLAGIVRSNSKTRLVLKGMRPLDHAIHAGVVAEAERRLKVVGLRIGTTGSVTGPVVIGIHRPRILIPVRYLETLSREDLLQVLIHEGAHALRRDPLPALLQRICRALFWWHPLVHLVNQRLTGAREEVCDNFVLTHVEPETYGATLLRLAMLSPANANVPMAIGMLDGRGKLEDRIRGLLDSRRIIMTRVGFGFQATVLGALALFSVFVAAARVGARNPVDAARPDSVIVSTEDESTAAGLAEAVDVKEFRLVLTYHGDSDKPFYNLILSVPPVAVEQNSFTLFLAVSEEQARKIVKHLTISEFFQRARVTDNQNDPTNGPQYLLRVRHDGKHYQESLGWDAGTSIRLDGIRKALDGDATKLMDRLLTRLRGQRKLWESGEIVDGLKTTLSAENDKFAAGKPIPIKLELANVGEEVRQYGQHRFILNGSEILVFDDLGRRIPYVLGGAGLKHGQVAITPAETKVIEECDLSDYYYLRRPGRYHVTFNAAGLPPSNALHFDVLPDEAATADGDPMGKLLPFVAGKWIPQGSPNASATIRPGRNRAEVAGWHFVFPLTDRGIKGSRAVVWLWLSEELAEEVTPAAENVLQTSTYAGRVSRWHVYIDAPPAALEVWPTAIEDLKAALDEEARSANDRAANDDDDPVLRDRYKSASAPSAPKWGETRNGLRARIASDGRTFRSGKSIPVKLVMENVGEQTWKVPTTAVAHHLTLVVVDDQGRAVPYLGGLSQLPERLEELAPGQSRELMAFDLGELYYLRRPGRYSVKWPGGLVLRGDFEEPGERATGPPSAPFEFEVVADPAATSDGTPNEPGRPSGRI